MSADIIPSFEKFNYMLRTNKHIERKLVFDLLSVAAQHLDFSKHWYLGFGSVWFGDFRLADRMLSIEKMISIERTQHAERAKFNRPLAGITVSPGECNAVLKDLSVEWENPLVAWLDYEVILNESVVEDIEIILGKAAVNSVIVITVNATFLWYKFRTEDKRQRVQTAVGLVESYLGSAAIAPNYQPKEESTGGFRDSVNEKDFPKFLSEAILTHIVHKTVNLAREDDGYSVRFVPLYHLHHKDGADMITVGGAVTTEKYGAMWEESLTKNKILSEAKRPVYLKLDLIPVTILEKIMLDTCLPEPAGEDAYLAEAKATGIKLSDDEILKYRKFYRHFPMFVETPM